MLSWMVVGLYFDFFTEDFTMYEKLSTICRKYNISLLYLFGSQKESATRISHGLPVSISDPMTDIDVGVVFCDQIPIGLHRAKLYGRLYNELEDLFLPYKLDLVFLEENHSVFQAEALKGNCIYCKDIARKELYEEDILRRACDFAPYLQIYYREFLEGY